MSRRTLSLAAIVVVVVGLFAVGLAVSGSNSNSLHAIPINPPLPAPLTAGRDSTGQLVSVPEGDRPALVTFFYAHCLTTCPLVAGEIAAALDEVGPTTTSKIDVVAISVDPTGDTPAAVNQFLKVHDLTGRLEYIIGSRSELEPLWQAWNIRVQSGGQVWVPSMHMYMPQISHTALIVLINKQGQQVGTYAGSTPFAVSSLASDIQTLVNS